LVPKVVNGDRVILPMAATGEMTAVAATRIKECFFIASSPLP
jgi:hypothetical protein